MRETTDTCVQKQLRIPCRDRARSRGRMKEREARGASIFFRLSSDSRVSQRQPHPGRLVENEPYSHGSDLPSWRHPFLPRRRGQAAGLITRRRRLAYLGSFADTQMDEMT